MFIVDDYALELYDKAMHDTLTVYRGMLSRMFKDVGMAVTTVCARSSSFTARRSQQLASRACFSSFYASSSAIPTFSFIY